MKTKRTIVVTGFALMMFFSANADERTGREISELVKSLDKDLSVAKAKVDKLEETRRKSETKDSGKLLPKRAEALRDLDRLTEELDNTKDVNRKKAIEGKLEKQVIKVAECSADFLEAQKNSLKNQDQQLEVMEEALASVIGKMYKLQRYTEKKLGGGNAIDIEKAKLQERRNLQRMARVIEMMAAKNGKAHHWRSVRQTIALRNAILSKRSVSKDNIYKMLATQREVYEQVLSQISIIRQELGEERELLAQVAIGEVARSLLRKAASLLLGNHNIEEIGKVSLAKVERRQQKLLEFMNQDKANSGNTYYSIDPETSDEYPAGYESFLTDEIK
ncbi:MAG: hypothetical protein GXP32_10100 [Kiritimatiellaeota bacterium]|nr:hypothetical protein [Kiritimatiellota bacterium]